MHMHLFFKTREYNKYIKLFEPMECDTASAQWALNGRAELR